MVTRSSETHRAIERFRAMGGVIDFSLFEDCDATLSAQRDCIADHFRHLGQDVSHDNAAVLQTIVPDVLGADALLGDWYDPVGRKLVARGTYRLAGGGNVENPAVEELDTLAIIGGGRSIPAIGERGQFAYAYYQTPYGLRGTGADIQAAFDGLWATLSPPDADCSFFDWSSPDLVQFLPPYFSAGDEWWGMFLYTVSIPGHRRLWAMSASTTD